MLADINNDSKTDLVVVVGYTYYNEGKVRVAKSTGTGFTFWSWQGNTIG